MTHKATIENIGPWNGRHEFEFETGINVLQAPNGRGKTIFLQSMMALACGEGRLPLNDGAKKGLVEGFGARITVGAACRHMGEFELENLEGKLSISKLVDPGLKTPVAADRQRIKALATLLGCKATLETFEKHDALKDTNFRQTVGTKAAGMSDLCEMAAQIAKDYQAAALIDEDMAKKFRGIASGLEESFKDIDMKAESDQRKLQQAYDEAVRNHASLESKARAAAAAMVARNSAQQRLKELKASYTGVTVAEAEAKRDTLSCALAEATNRRIDLEAALRVAIDQETNARRLFEEAGREVIQAQQVAKTLDGFEEVVNAPLPTLVATAEIEAAAEAIEAARLAIENGARIRDAQDNRETAKRRLEDAMIHDKIAQNLREASKAVDQVLSDAIKNPHLWVESVDDVARLVAKHPTRGTVPFDELSAGERWRIAIDLAADLVGAGGLVVIDQEGWEGIDAFERPKLHAHAVERNVIIVTAEATRDADEGTAPKVIHLSEAVAA